MDTPAYLYNFPVIVLGCQHATFYERNGQYHVTFVFFYRQLQCAALLRSCPSVLSIVSLINKHKTGYYADWLLVHFAWVIINAVPDGCAHTPTSLKCNFKKPGVCYLVLFGICNMGMSGLPDGCTLGPEGWGCTNQVDHECPCYKYYVTLSPTFPLWFSVS